MAVSLFQLAQATAFVIGPAIQAAFAPLGTGVDAPVPQELELNLYTGPSWLSVILSLINFCAFFPFIFTEFNIAKEEGDFLAARSNKNKNEPVKKLKKPDPISLTACVIIFGSVQFNFVFLERFKLYSIYSFIIQSVNVSFNIHQFGHFAYNRTARMGRDPRYCNCRFGLCLRWSLQRSDFRSYGSYSKKDWWKVDSIYWHHFPHFGSHFAVSLWRWFGLFRMSS